MMNIPEGVYVKDVDINPDVETVQETCTRPNLGVILLLEVYAVGADLCFKQDFEVFFLAENTSTSKYMRQMVSRGTRPRGSYSGTIFTLGSSKKSFRFEKSFSLMQVPFT